MIYEDIEKKDEKTLLILYKVIESNKGKLSFTDKIHRKLYCDIDMTSNEEIRIYDYLSDEGYIKPREDMKKVGMKVYYQSKDLDNYVIKDGFILISRIRKSLVSNVFVLIFKILKYVVGLLFV